MRVGENERERRLGGRGGGRGNQRYAGEERMKGEREREGGGQGDGGREGV